MLQLIIGRSGFGKTTHIRSMICDAVWAGRDDCILLVPEQYSFESERALIKTLGVRKAANVRVLSFTRMAETVQKECGGFAGRRIDDGIRMLLMSRAFEECADNLSVFGRVSTDPGMIEAALNAMREFTGCGIAAHVLEQAADTLPESALRSKVQELSLVFSAYEATLHNKSEENYIDPLDDLSALADTLLSKKSGFAQGSLIFVDGFKGFTGQEMQVLRALMKRAELINVALCTDTLDENGGLFSAVTKTAGSLREMAYQDNVAVAVPIKLTENCRAVSPALRFAERGIFRPRPEKAPDDETDDSVIIAGCADIYEECAFVARSIRRYLRESGARCRDIAIVARDLNPYRGILDAALTAQGIAYLEDERADIFTQPLAALALAAIDCITDGFSSEDVMRLLKTGMAGFSTRSVSMLENYVLMWGISGKKWLDSWTWNPFGLTAASDEISERRLRHLNLLRRRLVSPLIRLRDSMFPAATGIEFSRALYEYFIAVRAPRITRMRAARLDRDGEPAEADRLVRLWDMMMDMLDSFAAAFAHETLVPARINQLFRLLIQTAELGSVPQSLDAVQLGAADRIRFSSPKAVYILGANEGVFPAWPSSGGILSDSERRTLTQAGLPLSGGAEEDAAEERLLAYLAVAAPSERLTVSYISGSSASGALPESILVKSLKNILPGCTLLPLPGKPLLPPEKAESRRDGFDSAASVWRDTGQNAVTLREIFRADTDYAGRTAALDRAASRTPAGFESGKRTAELFGNNMVLSPTMVEAYHKCRFQYFCRYGLHAMPRKIAQLDGLATGTVLHHVLESVLPGYAESGYEGIDKKTALADAAHAVSEYAERVMGGLDDKPGRFAVLLGKLSHTAGLLLWRVVSELKQSRFEPVDYELNIGLAPDDDNPGVPPVILTLPDSTKVRVVGKIDRVDMLRRDGQTYIRVVDYKSSVKELLLSDVVEGINVQMLIYLFSIWQNGKKRYNSDELIPAGVLYLPGALPVVALEDRREAESDATQRKQLKTMKMTGLLLDDPEIIRAMELSAEGVFIPASITSSGTFSKGSSIASLAQFGALRKKVNSLLSDMAQTLKKGDIAAIPAAGTVDACGYCDYFSVCGFESGDKIRYIEKRPPEEIFDEIMPEKEMVD